MSSKHYEQKYDKEGHPENQVTKDRDGQLRIATNEALASVGVCIDVHGNIELEKILQSKDLYRPSVLEDNSKVVAVSNENEIGLIIATADLGLACLASTCMLGIRNRLQVGQKN